MARAPFHRAVPGTTWSRARGDPPPRATLCGALPGVTRHPGQRSFEHGPAYIGGPLISLVGLFYFSRFVASCTETNHSYMHFMSISSSMSTPYF